VSHVHGGGLVISRMVNEFGIADCLAQRDHPEGGRSHRPEPGGAGLQPDATGISRPEAKIKIF